MTNNRLRVLRAERRASDRRGWSQMDVARRAKMSNFRYWQIENGYVEATDQERTDLARVFKVDSDAVFPQRAIAS